MESYSTLISTPVTVFVTLSETNDDLHTFSGELLMVDATGVLVGSGIQPRKLRFFPRERVARIESQ